MERFQQENRHNNPTRPVLWDDKFTSSTLKKRDPTASQNALSARNSRAGDEGGSQLTKERAGVTYSHVEDGDSSPDELDILRNPPPIKNSAPKNTVVSQTAAKAKKGGTASNGLPSPPANARPAIAPVKRSKKKLQATTDFEDETASQKKSVKMPEAPKAKVPSPKDGDTSAQEKAVKKRKHEPAIKIGGITASPEDKIVETTVKEKGTGRRAGPLKSNYAPRPFPMDLSDSPMAGSSRAISSTPQVAPTRAKLATCGSSSTRDHQNEVESVDFSDSDACEVNFTYTQAVRLNEADPKLLCPFCDDRLPETPSDILMNMLERLKLRAKPDPRYGNSLGLKLDMSQYVSFCARHTAESEEFPRGQKYGWPTTFDTPKLANRIWKLQSQLRDIIDDPEEGTFFVPLQATAWKYGKSAVTGAKGSWATFENASTGYYGEQGLALITQVLFDMFPSVPSEKISPLDLASYYSLVLVPEAALLLIQEDLQRKKGNTGTVTRSQALKTLRKSTKYGLALFPVVEGSQPNAGDDIVRRRARKMRKLRDQEEEERRVTSSQATEIDTDGIVLDLSSDPDPSGKQSIPRKRRAQRDVIRKSVESPIPPIEKKVSKKRNLTGQPGGLAWSGEAEGPALGTPSKSSREESLCWLLTPN